MLPQTAQEWLNVIYGVRVDELAIVEDQADPQIVHKHRESSHNSQDTPRATELISNALSVFLRCCQQENALGMGIQQLVCLLALLGRRVELDAAIDGGALTQTVGLRRLGCGRHCVRWSRCRSYPHGRLGFKQVVRGACSSAIKGR